MTQVPGWIRRARQNWKYRGQARPPFAQPVTEGQESVWDYPRPPLISPATRKVVVQWGEVVIAETTRALRLLETASPPTFYLPPEDVRVDLLGHSPATSFCEWKGQATYWSLEYSTTCSVRNVGWSYEQPFSEYNQIAGFLSFYPGRLECYVDHLRVEPQPGGMYGGWVTPEVVGPFKGEPGTEGW